MYFNLLRKLFLSLALAAVSAGSAVAGMAGYDVAAWDHFIETPTSYERFDLFGEGIIGDGWTTFVNPDIYSVHISDTQIIVDGFAPQFDHQRFSDGFFNGILLGFGTSWQLPNFAIDSSTNWSEFTADRIGSGVGQLALNFAGLDVDRSTRLVLDITDTYPDPGSGFPGSGASTVPEPETYAMVLAGLGMMGLVARRKKKA